MVRLTLLKWRTVAVATLSTISVAAGGSAASATPAGPGVAPHAALTAATRPASPHAIPDAPPGVAPTSTARTAADQLRVDRAAARIDTLSRSVAGAGFAGLTVSGPQQTVTVYWHGQPSSAARTLLGQLRRGGLVVNVHQAPYTQKQIDARARDVIARRGAYQQAGIAINAVFTPPDGTGVVVYASANRREAGRKVLPAMAGDPMNAIPATLVVHPPATPQSRLSDFTPHWAGARIQDGPTSCTSGFPIVRKSDGQTFILTAGHCGAGLWQAWAIPDAQHNYVFGNTSNITPGLDIEDIQSSVQGRTYDGGVKPGTDFSKPVVGTSGNQVGDSVCQSGSWTGIHCGLLILEHGFVFINGNFVPGWAACQQTGGLVSVCTGIGGGEGDSGAPVFSLAANPGQVLARGSISAGLALFGFSCTNNNGETTTCSQEEFFVDIQDILNNYGARILTSP